MAIDWKVGAEGLESKGIGRYVYGGNREIAPGLTLQTNESVNSNGEQKSNTLTFNPKTVAVKPVVTSGEHVWGRETVAQMAQQQSGTVVAGVNGSFFDINNGTPRGEAIEDGELTSAVAGYDRVGTTTYPGNAAGDQRKNGYALVGFRKDGSFASGVGNYSLTYDVTGSNGSQKVTGWNIYYFNKYYSPMNS